MIATDMSAADQKIGIEKFLILIADARQKAHAVENVNAVHFR